MQSDPDQSFNRLAPFIQTYIYQHSWKDLRDIQKAAIPAILDTNDHILIMSGTASGKTEAAMLPVLTLLDQSPANSVGALYIGPLKALINDQFNRIQELLHDRPDIPIQSWHGDISYTQRQRFLQKPRGILQITPEALEALLINKFKTIKAVFGDLRFIIIDEIHAFLGTERGQQVLCQIQRLERILRHPIRRIGLSATIGNTSIALQWLQSSALYEIPARLITESPDETNNRHIQLRLNHFVIAPEKADFNADMAPQEISEYRHRRNRNSQNNDDQGIEPRQSSVEKSDLPDRRLELQKDYANFYDDLFNHTVRNQKTLIFTNRRNKAEQIAAALRSRLQEIQPGQDWYFVHHSSIAAYLRTLAETRMRDETQQSCTIATASLELGIDVGRLDMVVQIDAPHTVSSFVQRLGRSGRRDNPSRMCFYTFEYIKQKEQGKSALEKVPWNFLYAIALIQLYLEERWIEPPDIPSKPLSLLYQQTMSTLKAHIELTPPQLAQSVLTLSPFQEIERDEYRDFLLHLIEQRHIQRMEEGTLIIGEKGERIVNFYHFYAIFADGQEYRVMEGTHDLGTIQQMPDVDSIIGLAGYAWRVMAINEKKRTVQVERAKGSVSPNWMNSGNLSFHEHVMSHLRQVLQEKTIYPYLSLLARQRLTLAREEIKQAGWLRSNVVELGKRQFVLFPWTGSRIYRTLIHLFEQLHWRTPQANQPYYIEIVYDGELSDVLAALHTLSPRVLELIQLRIAKLSNVALYKGKYDYLAPRSLLEKSYISDMLDILGTTLWLNNCT